MSVATASISGTSAAWPPASKIDATRVLRGEPEASAIVLDDGPSYELGLWRSTPGEFTSSHPDYVEFVQILDGTGNLIDADGVETPLSSGVAVLMPIGWRGRWVIESTLTKAYTLVNPGGRPFK